MPMAVDGDEAYVILRDLRLFLCANLRAPVDLVAGARPSRVSQKPMSVGPRQGRARPERSDPLMGCARRLTCRAIKGQPRYKNRLVAGGFLSQNFGVSHSIFGSSEADDSGLLINL